MYSADDALRDLETILYVNYWDGLDEEIERLMNYLHEQRRKEGIPELLRGG